MPSFKDLFTPGLMARPVAQIALYWVPSLLALFAAFEAGRWSAALGNRSRSR